MNRIVLELDENHGHYCLSIENVILLSLHSLLGHSTNIQLNLVQNCSKNVNNVQQNLILKSRVSTFNKHRLKKDKTTQSLRAPLFICNCNIFTSGLCAVARKLILQHQNVTWKKLLGFKNSCLQAPTETSCWTKFCEIEMIKTVYQILNQNFTECDNKFTIPNTFSQFEAHLNQPIRMHNIFKVAREEKITFSESQKESVQFVNRFAEGAFFTLADIMLYVCFFIAFRNLPNVNDLNVHFPLIIKWMNEVAVNCESLNQYLDLIDTLTINKQNIENSILYSIELAKQHSLYKSDPKRYKPKSRIFTSQIVINENLEKFSNLNISTNTVDVITKKNFQWNNISNERTLDCNEVPAERLNRKKNQIQSMVDVIFSIAKDGDVIVDFCSGAGHLGITLACLLPKCQVILLENKSFSIEKAKTRVESLKLKNCKFYQSNIDYFHGDFDIGTSLHACGTATDIVLMKCILNQSSFVCCPCCYGSISPMPHINYPRSVSYKTGLTEKEYLYIAHAADQTHKFNNTNFNECKNTQGVYCMNIIDTDRLCLAAEYGYKTLLTTLKPEDCTLKNRLLIGSIDLDKSVLINRK